MLFVDKNKNLFRQIVANKFTLKTNPVKIEKEEGKTTDKLASVKKLSPPILAKFPKEVNKISKYFKPSKLTQTNKTERKSYTQVFKPTTTTTKEVLKIKEAFPNLKANKIKNIQKIINNNSKPKLRLNMTTKSLFRKQIIISISNNNKTKFMKESSDHVTNINKLLQSIKSDIKVDFICLEYLEVIIVTNKVVFPLDFQMIEKYVKNTNYIIVDSVEVPCFP